MNTNQQYFLEHPIEEKITPIEINPDFEGVDHIRVDASASHYLGRALAPEYPSVFYHPKYGTFLSIQSMVMYFCTDQVDEEIRQLTSDKLMAYINEKSYTVKPISEVHDVDIFRALRSAVFYRILAKPEILEQLVDSDLPIYVYSTRKGVPQRRHGWLEKHLTVMRDRLKTDKSTDTVFLSKEASSYKTRRFQCN